MIYINNKTGELWVQYDIRFWCAFHWEFIGHILLENPRCGVRIVPRGTLESEFTFIGEL